MILADSSAWIEYLRSTESPAAQRLEVLLDRPSQLRTTEVVVMELLAGEVQAKAHADLRRLLYRFQPLLTNGLPDYEAAAELYRACRRGGETIRKMNDCLIAAVAIRNDASVLHRDADFDVLARHTPLRIEPVSA
ncbi:type II toxin-antitoxin system toxin ribonuclease VapC11 [soil metagenome]|nr:PIN domain nuclease [Acidimicrobiia bacterium]